MKSEQLRASIDKITQAIELITECKGYDYLQAHRTVNIMIEERNKMNKKLAYLSKEEK